MQINEGILLATLLVCINFLFNRLKDFSCSTQALLNDNLLAKHAFNILAIFFVLVLFTRSAPLEPKFILLLVMLMYVFFIMITKCDYRFLVLFLILMGIVFYMEADKNWRFRGEKFFFFSSASANKTAGADAEEEERKTGNLTKRDVIFAQFWVELFSLIVVLIGVIVYMGQHSREFVEDWSWKSFWLGVNKCTGDGIPIRKSVWGDLVDGLRRIVNLPPLPGGEVVAVNSDKAEDTKKMTKINADINKKKK